jgi:energy-coupling factor transporter ATP-binding protein EcfA2
MGLSKDLEKAEKGEPERKSQADKLVALCLLEEPTLFTDQTGMPFAYVNQKGVKVTLPLRSRLFKSWLSSLLWEAEQKAPGNEAISSALNILVSKAMFEGPRITLYNRVAPGENCFWLDMTDDKHRAIKITSEGWSIVDDPPILFKRYNHQLPLAIPTRGSDAWRLLEFCNIVTSESEQAKLDSKDMIPNTKLVVICNCVSFLIPTIPHPMLLLYGIQGSGKSVIFKLLKRLLDPSSIELLTLPKNESERIQQLEHHWLSFYDNVTRLPYWMSDTLCRAVTGSGFSKRELYSDDDDVIYAFKRCVGLNGINIAAQTGDLLDRAVLVGLTNIEKEKRRTEEELFTEFEKCKPEILGAFLGVLVKAMQLYPQVDPAELFRMADFTKWGCAISRALGNTEKEFLDAYGLKVKAQSEEAAHASPVATILLDSFSTAKEPWEGTPTQLYMRLNEHAKMLGISTRQKAWPKAPNTLVRRLNELVPSLKSLGLDIETGIREGHGGPRRVRINTVTTVTPHEKHGEKGDDKGDDSKNEPLPEPSLLEHGQLTLGVDGDDTFINNSGKATEAEGHRGVGSGKALCAASVTSVTSVTKEQREVKG